MGQQQACELGQTFGDSGYVITDDLIFSMKSAQAVAAVSDFIEANYCDEQRSSSEFEVGTYQHSLLATFLFL